MKLADLFVKLGFHVDSNPLEHLEHKLDGIKERLEFLAAAEIVKGLYELAERFSGMGVQLETASASAGLTTDAFQKLSYAAAQSAVSQEQLTTGLGHLSRVLQEAKDGSQSAIDAFAKANITTAQIAGFRTSSDALHALSESFRATNDPIKKQALAMQLLGRGSINMVNLLNKGGAAIDRVGEQAEAAGAVLSEKSIESLAKFEETMVSAGQTLKVAFAEVAAVVGPVIGVLVKHIQTLYAADSALIKTNIKAWGIKFAYALGFIVGLLTAIVRHMRAWADEHPLIVKRIGEVVLAGLALSLVATGILRIFELIKALSGAVQVASTAFAFLKGAGSGALTALIAPLRLIKFLLGWIIRGVSLLAARWFPKLALAIRAFSATILSSPLLPFVAAVGAAVLAVQALWVLLHGGNFRDTWLGAMIAQLLDLPEKLIGLWHWFKNGTYDAKQMGAHEWPAYLRKTEEQKEEQEKAESAYKEDLPQSDPIGSLMAKMGITQNAVDQYKGGMQGPMLSGSIMDLVPLTPVAPPAIDFAGGTGQMAMKIEAPVTINVPPGLAPERAAKAVSDGVQKHLDRVNREAMRGVQTAQVY